MKEFGQKYAKKIRGHSSEVSKILPKQLPKQLINLTIIILITK